MKTFKLVICLNGEKIYTNINADTLEEAEDYALKNIEIKEVEEDKNYYPF